MKFSIVAPIFNESKHISRSIDSVLEQNVDFELLFLDEGSTDNTEEIVRNYNNPGIKFITIPGRGLADIQGRVNEGIKLSTGDLFFLSSGHDWFFPGAFKAIADNIGESKWIMGRLAKVGENGKIYRKISNPGYACGFVRLDFLKEHDIKLNPNLAAADYDFFLQIRKYAGEPKRIDDYIFKYMIHPSALSKKFGARMKRERKRLNTLYGI